MLRTGAPWRDLPAELGKWNTVYRRYRRWAVAGRWEALRQTLEEQHCRGGFSTKLHALVTEHGRLVRYVLTGGEASDITQAKELVSKDIPGRGIVGDRGYDSNEFVAHLRQLDLQVVIPARANRLVPRSLDREVYRLRNVIERWFGRLKQFRRIATRYYKTERSYRGFIALGASELALSGWGA